MPYRHATFKKLNRLSDPRLGHANLYELCSCREKSGNPGPHHASTCPCFATHKIDIFRCDGLWGSKVHPEGPIKLVINPFKID
jgi:hypothetical protein